MYSKMGPGVTIEVDIMEGFSHIANIWTKYANVSKYIQIYGASTRRDNQSRYQRGPVTHCKNSIELPRKAHRAVPSSALKKYIGGNFLLGGRFNSLLFKSCQPKPKDQQQQQQKAISGNKSSCSNSISSSSS